MLPRTHCGIYKQHVHQLRDRTRSPHRIEPGQLAARRLQSAGRKAGSFRCHDGHPARHRLHSRRHRSGVRPLPQRCRSLGDQPHLRLHQHHRPPQPARGRHTRYARHSFGCCLRRKPDARLCLVRDAERGSSLRSHVAPARHQPHHQCRATEGACREPRWPARLCRHLRVGQRHDRHRCQDAQPALHRQRRQPDERTLRRTEPAAKRRRHVHSAAQPESADQSSAAEHQPHRPPQRRWALARRQSTRLDGVRLWHQRCADAARSGLGFTGPRSRRHRHHNVRGQLRERLDEHLHDRGAQSGHRPHRRRRHRCEQ